MEETILKVLQEVSQERLGRAVPEREEAKRIADAVAGCYTKPKPIKVKPKKKVFKKKK